MTGNAFVTEDWTRIFNRRADIKVLRLRVVSRYEIKAGWILVVNSGRIHKTSGAGWLECFGQLSDFERAEVIGDGDELMFFQEFDHLLFATLVSF